MNIKDKESLKSLPIGDFIVTLKKDEIIEAAEKMGYIFSRGLHKKALVARLAQVYAYFPQQIQARLSASAKAALRALHEGGAQADGNTEGMAELCLLGMALLLEGETPGRVAVTSRSFLDGIINNLI